MPYALPPNNTNPNAAAGGYSYVQQWRAQDDSQARMTTRQAMPGGTILDITANENGMPHKAHVRDRNGTIKTVTFDDNQDVSDTQDGYC